MFVAHFEPNTSTRTGQRHKLLTRFLREAALTPRTKAKLLVERVYEEHRSHLEMGGLNKEEVATNAYLNTQNAIVRTAQQKDARGISLTSYEKKC